MKEFIAKYQKAIVGTGAVAVLIVCYLQQKELTKLRAEQKIEVLVGGDIEKANLIDSLHDELFNAKVEAGRYELSLEHLYEVNPKAAKEFQDYMEHETE
jgi:hypothetical protein